MAGWRQAGPGQCGTRGKGRAGHAHQLLPLHRTSVRVVWIAIDAETLVEEASSVPQPGPAPLQSTSTT